MFNKTLLHKRVKLVRTNGVVYIGILTGYRRKLDKIYLDNLTLVSTRTGRKRYTSEGRWFLLSSVRQLVFE